MIKLINTNKRLAFVESNSKGIVVERENTFSVRVPCLKEIRTTLMITLSFVVKIMYNTDNWILLNEFLYVLKNQYYLVRLFVFLHPCFRCDRFLVWFLTSVLVKGGNSKWAFRTKTDFLVSGEKTYPIPRVRFLQEEFGMFPLGYVFSSIRFL